MYKTMKHIILIILILISFVGYSQTYSMKDSRSGDTVQRIIQTTKASGIVKYLLITGTDTAEIRWNGTKLLLDGYNLADSIDLSTDSIAALRVNVNANLDSLGIHLDSLQALRINTNANLDSIGIHLDSLQSLRITANKNVDSITVHRVQINKNTDSLTVHRTQLNKNIDSLGVHLDTLQTLRTDINTNLDSLQDHRTDINTAFESIDATNISQVKFTTIGGTVIKESLDHTHNNLALVTQLADYRTIADPSLLLGTDFKIIIYNDTMCGIKISTTDTARIVPTR